MCMCVYSYDMHKCAYVRVCVCVIVDNRMMHGIHVYLSVADYLCSAFGAKAPPPISAHF